MRSFPWLPAGDNFAPLIGGSVSYSAEAQQFFDRISDPGTTIKNYYATMIDGLVAGGSWALIDALYIFAAPSSATAKINLKSSSFPLTEHGTVSYTANSHAAGNGTTGYWSTALTETGSGNFGNANGSIGAYTLTNRTSGGGIWAGTTNSGAGTYSYLGYSTVLASEFNGATFQSVAAANARGLSIAVKTTSTNINLYKNGSSLGSISSISISLTDLEWYIGAYNQFGTAQSFSDDNIAAIFIGGNVDANIANLDTYINGFMTSQGVNVY